MKRGNTQIVLDSYPSGAPAPENFRRVEVPIPELQDGEVLVQTIYLSMDPFPRLRMAPDSQMGPPMPLGGVVACRGAGRVVASRNELFPVGTPVAGDLGWQEFAALDGAGLRAVDVRLAPLSASLGVLGPSGLAAHLLVTECGRPRPGETLVLTAAAGAVGSIAGQVARLRGARVVGLVLGSQQAGYVRDELAFDDVVDLRGQVPFEAALATACPRGVDVFLDSVGGATHNAVMDVVNVHARVVAFGFISSYNVPGTAAPEYGRIYEVIRKRVHLMGFLLPDHAALFPAAMQELAAWYRQGSLKVREHVTRGLERAPEAFAAIFGEAAPGKQLVQVADDAAQ